MMDTRKTVSLYEAKTHLSSIVEEDAGGVENHDHEARQGAGKNRLGRVVEAADSWRPFRSHAVGSGAGRRLELVTHDPWVLSYPGFSFLEA
jgi:hypothetical protein